MGFLSKLLNPKSAIVNPGGYILGKAGIKQPDPGSKAIQYLAKQVNPASGNPAAGPQPIAPGLPGGLGAGAYGMPMQNQPPLQLPQMQPGQLPQFLSNPQGFGQGGGMPFVRDQAMMNTLAPFFQQNYGVPFISPYGQGGGMGGGLGQPPGVPPGANPGTMPYQPPPPPGFGMPGRIGLQPIRGGYG